MVLNGKPHGQGRVTTDGDSYVGEWKDGKRHGTGTMNFSNGDVYFGEWKNARQHGQGFYIQSDGSINREQYENGTLIESVATNFITSRLYQK